MAVWLMDDLMVIRLETAILKPFSEKGKKVFFDFF